MCKRRVKPAGYWQKWLSPQSARTRRNPRKHAVVGKKKPTPKGWFFLYWWSRGELNPRPQAITGQFYMLSRLI